jgi:hypothetical protein
VRRRLQQLQCAVKKRHVAVRRDDVGAVGLHAHAVFNLEDLHAGVAADQFGEEALVIRRQMLHQHKGHAWVGIDRHAGEEGFKRGQPTRGGADTDDRKRGARRNIGNRGRGADGRRQRASLGFFFCFIDGHTESQRIPYTFLKKIRSSGMNGCFISATC